MTVDELISQLSNTLTSNPDSINSDIINKLNKMRKNNPDLVERLKSQFKGYNIHVSNNKLHMSRYESAIFPPLSNGGKRHKKHTRRHKKQKRTRRHRKH